MSFQSSFHLTHLTLGWLDYLRSRCKLDMWCRIGHWSTFIQTIFRFYENQNGLYKRWSISDQFYEPAAWSEKIKSPYWSVTNSTSHIKPAAWSEKIKSPYLLLKKVISSGAKQNKTEKIFSARPREYPYSNLKYFPSLQWFRPYQILKDWTIFRF